MQTKFNSSWIILIISGLILMQPHVVNAASPQEEYAACLKGLAGVPELAGIKGKVGLSGVSSQTFEMKTNNSYPTKVEKQAIAPWVEKVHGCFDIVEKAISNGQVHPSVAPLIRGLYAKFEQRALQLYDMKITYGEFARARDEDNASYLKELADAKHAYEQQQDQLKRQAQQEQLEKTQHVANEKAARCQAARQNAATFCNKGNQGVVVNVGPNTYSNTNSSTPAESMSCGWWSGAVMTECN